MEEVLLRFSHLGERIFDSLDDKSLTKCQNISRTWNHFILDQKFTWVRIVKKYVKESNVSYKKSSPKWKKMFHKTRLICVKELAKNMQKSRFYFQPKGYSPLHFIVDENLGYFNPSNRFEIFKNIFEEEEDKNPKDLSGSVIQGIVNSKPSILKK